MDFTLSPSQIDIQQLARTFAEREIGPIIVDDEVEGRFRPEIFRQAGHAGLLGITVPENLGGVGLGMAEYAVAMEEVATISSAYATSLSVTSMVMSIIEKFAANELQNKYLPRLISGEWVGAFALTEPDSGSDAAGLKTLARLDGDYYVLNGLKQFITNGMNADVFIVMARTGGEGAKGISAFVVEKSFGVRGGKLEKKMGMKTSHTQEIIFDNVRVPKTHLLAKEGDGFTVAKSSLDGGRIAIAAIAVGLARAALEKAIAYAREREQFGKPVMDFQGVSFMLADRATELAAARLLVQRAASQRDQGMPSTMESSMAKLYATEACMRITTDAVQVFGGYGYIEDYIVERYMREAKVLQLVEGTSQIQRLVIARNL